tara:strand:- start:133 stop:1113 length:981 start_codon:yes stop_codon:yes gene_type:complete
MQTVTTFNPGNAGAWTINGFDQTLYDYIAWSNGTIQFNDSPAVEAFIFQPIEDLDFGQTYELSFDLVQEQGNLMIGYFNLNGEGFVHVAGGADSTGHIVASVTVGDANQSSVSTMPSGGIFIASHTAAFTGTVDNINITRVYTINDIDAHQQTVTFNEDVKGWVSFKSFIPENGLSLSNKYYTLRTGRLYQHDVEDQDRNTFYGVHEDSTVTAVLNQEPSSVKDFKTINYEGSQSKIDQYSTYDSTDAAGNPVVLSTISTYNLSDQDGWYSQIVITDQQEGFINEFIEKEGKWFNYIKGDSIPSNIDASKFNLQGLGIVQSAIANG